MINLVPSSPSWLSKLLPLYDYFFLAYVLLFALALGGTILMSYLAKELRRVADEKISLANDGATQARAQAASANAEAARATEQAGLANERAAEANKRAGEIAQENVKLRGEFDKATADARLKQEQLREQNLKTEAKLEQERTTRLELEQSLAPRELVIQQFEGGKTNFDALKPFAGLQVVFEVLPDAEATRAAGDIAKVLRNAGWVIASASLNSELNTSFFDGVFIQTPFHDPNPFVGQEAMAAEALRAFLEVNGWQASWAPVSRSAKMPQSTIKISVGFKPSRYFLDRTLRNLGIPPVR